MYTKIVSLMILMTEILVSKLTMIYPTSAVLINLSKHKIRMQLSLWNRLSISLIFWGVIFHKLIAISAGKKRKNFIIITDYPKHLFILGINVYKWIWFIEILPLKFSNDTYYLSCHIFIQLSKIKLIKHTVIVSSPLYHHLSDRNGHNLHHYFLHGTYEDYDRMSNCGPCIVIQGRRNRGG